MPGGNFDDVLTIDHQGQVTPSGPLEVAPDEVIISAYAWVMQKQKGAETGAACMGVQAWGSSDAGTKWTVANAKHEGRFEPGEAVGWALALATIRGQSQPSLFWWEDKVTLK